ncbi:GNAT family N-acetyltransferase [Rubritalea tangerina]|uniref:GNAT family N-acetyltransferase n=1 Tax=Rubritalea tangerina TaxID=430798 RepID=A0ABW4Z8M4_9BACT
MEREKTATDLRGLLHYVPQFRGRVFVIDLEWSMMNEVAQAEVIMDLVALQSIGVQLVVVAGVEEMEGIVDWAVDHEFRSAVVKESEGEDRVLDVLGRGQAVFYERNGGVISANVVQLSVAIQAVKLIAVSDFKPLETQGGQLKFLRVSEISGLGGSFSAEERAMLEVAAQACSAGIDRVHLLDGNEPGVILDELFSNEGVGTMVYAGQYRQIRMLREEDISEMLALIGRSVRRTHLVPRSYEQIADSLGDYAVMEVDGHVVGCVALYLYEGQAEIACLYVKQTHEGTGYGADLVRFMERRAAELGVTRVFALTNRAAKFFTEQMGYESYAIEGLPRERFAELEESGRGSQAFVKEV